ncbi:RNA polymerase III transcription factor IIIC subunit-domain-containing protein [Lactarius psammicola]|nr:RNA polymerase III transcription factor IIIC subunit-domain-containing protein [Lactarius psammicola]
MTERPDNSLETSTLAEPQKTALAHELPTAHFYSIEYPGYVRPESVSTAVHSLGGQSSIDRAFRRGAPKEDALLELNLRPDNPFSHPLPGDLVPTNNILLKVVKRRLKRSPDDDGSQKEIVGEYTAAAVGPPQDDPLSQLRRAMTALDVEGIREYRFPQEREDYAIDDPSAMDIDIDPQLVGRVHPEAQLSTQRSNLRLFPPPIFSRQGIPQNYNFKANPMSVPTTVVDEKTGEEKKRLINKARWKGYGPTSVSFAEKGVPTKPPSNVEEVRNQYDQTLVRQLEELFQTRPVWSRAALLNQFTAAQAREIHNSKVFLPLTCYVFGDGPWRDTMVRFGYDPRQDPQESRTAVTSMSRSSTEQARDDRRSHIFDGVTLTSETAAFQLCDITDPMLKQMIDEEEDVRDSCNVGT